MVNKRQLRIVLKFGSNLITTNNTVLNYKVINSLVSQIAKIFEEHEIVLVTSGAVAAGLQYISSERTTKILKKNSLVQKQILASVGQPILMKAYEESFDKHSISISQALLARGDFENRNGYLNIRNTLLELLQIGILPIINENDVVATEELNRYGDNDRLSAMVANAVDADILILLGTIDGLYTEDPNINNDAKKIEIVEKIDSNILSYAKGPVDKVGTGGMISKIQAANIATKSGISMYIASGLQNQVIQRIINDETVGTKFLPEESNLESRKRWLVTGYTSSKGEIILDKGAVKAVNKNASVLPAGVTSVKGNFDRGDIIAIKDEKSTTIGLGISNYSS
ncbi:MAG: glutamate 5-kinase, partial [Chloroflexi bacterium]|nr:glutamate 5-kinase [Chloroflexota bacterium]